MKRYSRLFIAALAAFGLASCSQELDQQIQTPQGNLVTVNFGAEAAIEGATKATLTPNEDDTFFKSAWENGDALGVQYYNDGMEGNEQVVHATWNETSYSFSTALPEFTGRWIYRAAYPAPEADGSVEFGSSRTQKGNAYNSKYDLMRGSVMTEAPAGKTDEGKDIIFDMTRETAIAYFHFTSKLAEKVVSAKLSVTGGSIANSSVTTDYHNSFVFSDDKPLDEITITFEEGSAPDATEFKLWYNVRPTSYSSMTLEVETTGHKMTINRNSEGVYKAGRLYKVVKDIDDKWVAKGGFTGGELVFDFKTHPVGWPAEKNESAGNYNYKLNGINYAFNLSTDVFCKGKSGDNGYLVLSAKTKDNSFKEALFGLPAIPGFKLAKVVGTINDKVSTVSTKTMVAIKDGKQVISGGEAQNWKTKGATHTYTLSDTEENTVYYMSATKANAQLMKLVLTYEVATPSAPKYAVSFATVEGGTLSASAIKAEEGTEITLTADPQLGYEFNGDWSVVATDGTAINVVDNKFTMPAQDVTVSGTFTSNIKYDHAGTENDPYNVLDVLKLIETLENGANSSEINAKGVIKSIKEVSTTYKNATYTIGDETTSETVTIYRGKYIDGADFTSTDQIKIGDEVVIKGRVTNYKGSKQFSTGSRIVSLKRMETCATPVINIDENGVASITCATEGATIRYTVGDAPADPTETSDVFSSATLTDGQTIKAIAVAENHKPSAVASKKYTAGGATTPVVLYTLIPGNGTNNAYANNCDVTINGIVWNLTGNSQVIPWKIGGKKITNVDRALYSKTAFPKALTSIKITFGTSNITVNSCKLVYSTNADFTDSKECNIKFTASSTIEVADNFPAKAYYKLVVNVTNNTTNNKSVELSKIEFLGLDN